MTKHPYKVLLALMVLPFIVTGIFFASMPERIPVHYNMAGVADRFGSKYESLAFPALTALAGTSFLVMARYKRKKNEPGNERIVLMAGMAVSALLNLMVLFFLWTAVSFRAGAAESNAADAIRFAVIGAGVLLIVIGNVMPKATLNGMVGLRTKWSMANERVWQKTQRFGGYSGMVCGLLLVLCGAFFTKTAALFAAGGCVLLWLAVGLIVSYRIYIKDAGGGPKAP